MDDLRKALSSLDSIETPNLWPEIERRAVTPEPAPQLGAVTFQTMLNSTKLIVAGLIVALFGGFLLLACTFVMKEAFVYHALFRRS